WGAIGSTGRCLTLVPGGYAPRKLSPFRFREGLMGRAAKPPPQFGHTLPKTSSTHDRQKVHSKLQIMASVESGGRALLQCSQVGRSSNIFTGSLRIRRRRIVFLR